MATTSRKLIELDCHAWHCSNFNLQTVQRPNGCTAKLRRSEQLPLMTASDFFAVDVDIARTMGIPREQSDSRERLPYQHVGRDSGAEPHGGGENGPSGGQREEEESRHAQSRVDERDPARDDQRRDRA